MKHASLLLVLAVLFGAAAVSWLTARAQDAAPRAKPTAVAVVGVQKVFNTCKEKGDIDANFQSALEKAETDKENRTKEINNLKYDIDLLSPDNAAFADKREEMERKYVELQVESTYRKNQVVREQMLRYENLYRKLKEACAEVARESGYDLVLFLETDKLTYQNPQELVNQIGGRKVLWASEELDITDQVIQKLNNVWDARERSR